MIWGSGGSKSRLAKAAGAEPAGQMRDEKLHAVVARSTFPSQNVQNTPLSDHFWKLQCQKSTRRCGAKQISKSKCTKHTIVGPLLEVAMSKKCTPLWHEDARSTFPSQNGTKHTMVGPLLEVEMSKECTPLWREAHFQVKMYKTPRVRTTFGGWDVEKVHAVVAQSTFPSQNVKNTRGSDHFGGSDVASLCFTTLHDTTLHYMILHYTTLQDITLHYTPVHYITLHYTPVHSTTLNYTTLHYLKLHYTPLHYNYNYNYTPTLHYTPLHSNTKLHYTTIHYTTLHYIPPHSTTSHYITLHYIRLNDTAPQIDRLTDR